MPCPHVFKPSFTGVPMHSIYRRIIIFSLINPPANSTTAPPSYGLLVTPLTCSKATDQIYISTHPPLLPPGPPIYHFLHPPPLCPPGAHPDLPPSNTLRSHNYHFPDVLPQILPGPTDLVAPVHLLTARHPCGHLGGPSPPHAWPQRSHHYSRIAS